MSFPEELQKLFPQMESSQWQQLKKFIQLLQEWNQRINLVSRNDAAHLWERHVVPSLWPLQCFNFEPQQWLLDIGSGGGFPAIPLKIASPQLQVVLVESVRKKSLFLRRAIQELGLTGIAVANQRVEDFTGQVGFERKFDWVTARAVADIETLVQWGRIFLRPGGNLLLWKGKDDEPELTTVAKKWDVVYQVFRPAEAFIQLNPRISSSRLFLIQFKR